MINQAHPVPPLLQYFQRTGSSTLSTLLGDILTQLAFGLFVVFKKYLAQLDALNHSHSKVLH